MNNKYTKRLTFREPFCYWCFLFCYLCPNQIPSCIYSEEDEQEDGEAPET